MKNFTVNFNDFQMTPSLVRSETMELFQDILKTLGSKPKDPEDISSSASTIGSTGSSSTSTKAKRRPVFKRRFHLRQRISDVKAISGRVWECQECSYWSYSKQALRRHKPRHEPTFIKLQEDALEAKEHDKITGDKKTSPATPNRRYRMRPRCISYNQIDGHLFQCPSCPAWFYQRNHVLRHEHNHH